MQLCESVGRLQLDKGRLGATHLDLSRLPDVASSWAKALAGAVPEAALPESASYQLLGLLKVPLNTMTQSSDLTVPQSGQQMHMIAVQHLLTLLLLALLNI